MFGIMLSSCAVFDPSIWVPKPVVPVDTVKVDTLTKKDTTNVQATDSFQVWRDVSWREDR